MEDTSMMRGDEFKAKAEAVAGNLNASGLLTGDEVDETEIDLCLLIPESCVAPLIGKAGANINTTKAVSGANVSFQKRENSLRGYRKCFHNGPLHSVMRAVAVALSFVKETTGGPCPATIVVKHDAAGGVIGKGGENLKNVREQTSCKVSMEKSQEAMPANGGRCLTLEHEETAQVLQAIYACVRSKGFSSPTSREDNQSARASPYGNGGGGNQDICAMHGKRRGRQNLRPHPSQSGLWVCLETDQCKGSANPNTMAAGAGYMMGGQGMGGQGMGGQGMGMGGQGMGAQGMGGMGLTMGEMFGGSGMYGMGAQGMGAQGMGMGGMQGQDMNNICAIHGKRRGARNLQPHPTQPGLFVCRDDDQCK